VAVAVAEVAVVVIVTADLTLGSVTDAPDHLMKSEHLDMAVTVMMMSVSGLRAVALLAQPAWRWSTKENESFRMPKLMSAAGLTRVTFAG
jgi:hypothetical protein